MERFRCYIDDAGEDDIGRWYDAQTAELRGEVDAILEVLAHTRRNRWRRKPFASLSNEECAGLGEIRIEVDETHYRILGYDGPGSRWFVLLYPFAKDCDPEYRIACPIAQSRKIEVENDPSRTRECAFP